MAQVMNTPNGPLLCSRINAGSAERGDLIISEHGHRIYRLDDVYRNDNIGHVVLGAIAAGTNDHFNISILINEPVWRAVGARAAGLIA